MDFPAYIFCKWKSRFWPAKVLTKLKKPLSKNCKLKVEIFEENEQISVKYIDIKPFLMVELQNISEDLDRSENLKVTPEELTYRSALSKAMNLLKEVRRTQFSEDDGDAAASESCRKAENLEVENECTSSNKNFICKKASGTIDAIRTKHSVCLKISDKPKIQKSTKVKDLGDGRKRKSVEGSSSEQSSLPGGKKATCKTGSGKNSIAGEHKSGKGRVTRDRFGSLPSEKETHTIMSSDTDEDIARKVNGIPQHLIPQPIKKDNIQVDSSIQQVRCDTEEMDSHRKSKYNRLPLPDFSFTETDLLSSELSMECSSPESDFIPDVYPNDDTEEDVQLPVIELKKEPASFERGSFVWCKFQRYPYWPSLVKSVRPKEKRASIIFVEECLSNPDSQKQSFLVSFRTLKHYDCPQKQELLDIARKDYGKSIDWCDALVCDYRIRLGCSSFSGSFLEYCTSAINRARASRDKANEKLVECIVKNKQAEHHLKAILTGVKKSHWLKKFQLSNQRLECLETYIEDEEQVELLVDYLHMLCDNMSRHSKKLMNGDQIKFILEVMLPEAVIFAISATEGLSYDKAEKKFLQGPLLSKRERKQFEKQILDKKRIKPEEKL
ncbi:PWWP domain-containing DNA repair factor 3A isoform X2 [Pyxicephalus adspersus]|uniref:PWWP domain-containing DNA repair factor 3A isoform X2 n=1 Tax=Pyxicephalus adspersus TaxID=30357 RepID=UPI003B5A68D0